MNENYQAMTEGVLHFLQGLGLPQYYEVFITKGYDMETDLMELDEKDLDALGISNNEHRATLKKQASRYTLTPEYKLYVWLKEYGLDYYFINFINGEYINLHDVAGLDLSDENIFDELEILLPGHKKRLKSAVKKLRKKERGMSPEFETPVTEGWWGKPEFLQEAKYDFLCVDALLTSTKENAVGSQRLQFMVDSGSDVVTVRQEILDQLDLELIGPIQSRGVHASRTKNLYRATLLIGNEELEIEVMGESYDSIGSRVIRHFRHYISGGRHVWLKGDYYDPTMSPKERITPSHFTTESCQSQPQQMGNQQLKSHVTKREPDTDDFETTQEQSRTGREQKRAIENVDSDQEKAECNLTKRPKLLGESDVSFEESTSSQTSVHQTSKESSLLQSSSAILLRHPSPLPTLISPLPSPSSPKSPPSQHTTSNLLLLANEDTASNDSVKT